MYQNIFIPAGGMVILLQCTNFFQFKLFLNSLVEPKVDLNFVVRVEYIFIEYIELVNKLLGTNKILGFYI